MIKDKSNSPHYTWASICDCWTLYDQKNLNVKLEIMPPDTSEQLHVHQKTQQFFFILKGEATFTIDKEIIKVQSHQGIAIQPNTQHRIANINNVNLEFLVISQPAVDGDRVDIEIDVV